MASASRFRRLPPPRLDSRPGPLEPGEPAGEPEPPERLASYSGDLFEHFGVPHQRGLEPPSAIVDAEPCRGCGWLRRADAIDHRCPLCAAPCVTSDPTVER